MKSSKYRDTKQIAQNSTASGGKRHGWTQHASISLLCGTGWKEGKRSRILMNSTRPNLKTRITNFLYSLCAVDLSQKPQSNPLLLHLSRSVIWLYTFLSFLRIPSISSHVQRPHISPWSSLSWLTAIGVHPVPRFPFSHFSHQPPLCSWWSAWCAIKHDRLPIKNIPLMPFKAQGRKYKCLPLA